ncbi:MAG: TRAP transporter substrate-binding protein DctP [Burkholderiaceae bacterium]|nr:TRAP transporter substrate-binding protein DctP [Burkholderiaceae bacterium]
MKRLASIALVMLLLGSLPAGANAQIINLRVADTLPTGSVLLNSYVKPYMETVEKESKGQIKFQHFPGGQLGKAADMLTLTQSGLVDIGYIVPTYISDKMPLTSVMEVPGAMGDDYCRSIRVVWKMTHSGGWLEKNEFHPNRVIPLLTLMYPSYQIIVTSGRKVESLKDLAGLKMRTAGGSVEYLMNNLGMIPVKVAVSESYDAMARGTIDGSFSPLLSLAPYGVDGLVKTYSTNASFGAAVLTYSIGEVKFKQLPEKVRALLLKVGEEVSLASCKKFTSGELEAQAMLKSKGANHFQFSKEDQKRIAVANIATIVDWATALDKRGKPGTATVDALRKTLAETQ